MKVCVVTVTFDRRFLLIRRQLLTLAAQNYRDFGVVVVDDASPCGDIEELCEQRRWNYPILYRPIHEEGLDIGRSYRFGCAQVPPECEIVVVVHGDTLLSPNALREFVALLESQDAPLSYAVQAVPENLLSNSALTDEILLGNFEQIDQFTLASIATHGDLRRDPRGHTTWEGDPFPRCWYAHYEPFRQALRRLDGLPVHLTWADLKRRQYLDEPEILTLPGMGLWNVCCAFWRGSVADLAEAWESAPGEVWRHEGWNGFARPVTLLFPSRVTVLHQHHFSEPGVLGQWTHLGTLAHRAIPVECYDEPQFRWQLEGDRLGYYC